MEVPKPKQVEAQPMQKYLMERKQASAAQPMPADDPGKLARRPANTPAPNPQSNPIDVPQPESDTSRPAEASPTERQLAESRTSDSSRQAPSQLEMSVTAPSALPDPTRIARQPTAASLSQSEAMPTIGDAGLNRMRR